MYLCIRPRKISLRSGSYAKLAPWFCELFYILEKVGSVTYRLALPPIAKNRNVFHTSLLKRYVHDANHVVDWFVIHVEFGGKL